VVFIRKKDGFGRSVYCNLVKKLGFEQMVYQSLVTKKWVLDEACIKIWKKKMGFEQSVY